MDLNLSGKVALVTGGSKGIGKAIAARLAQEGCRVILAARGQEAVDQAVTEIRAAGGDVIGKVVDILKPESIQAMVRSVEQEVGPILILVNNAGGVGRQLNFETLADEDFLEAFEANVLSVVRMVRCVLQGMRAARWGRVINITSEVATQPERIFPHYNAAKAAELNLTKSLSRAFGRDGILVNAVSPGLILTEGVMAEFEQAAAARGVPASEVEAEYRAKFKPGIVAGRSGRSEEVASIVAFLASDLASFTTGSNYRVDGGTVLTI